MNSRAHVAVGVKGVVLVWHFQCPKDSCNWGLTNYSDSEISVGEACFIVTLA